MQRFALIVGVEQYRDPRITPLRYACSDALSLAESLREKCRFDRVVSLCDGGGDGEPDLLGITRALAELSADLTQDDLFLFAYSGHGVELDGRGYLLTRDTPWAFPEHGSLSLEILRKTLARVVAGRRVLLLDACRNAPEAAKGEVASTLAAGLSKDIVAATRAKPERVTSTTALLAACAAGQRAYEWPAKKRGVFTHFLLEGLEGAAWVGDTLEFRTLAHYVRTAVSEWSLRTPGLGAPQEPWYEEVGDAGATILASGESPHPPRASPRAAKEQPHPIHGQRCTACGDVVRPGWVACPSCGRTLDPQAGPRTEAASSHHIESMSLQRRHEIYSKRLVRIKAKCQRASFAFAHLAVDSDPQHTLQWCTDNAESLCRSVGWFETFFWDGLKRRVTVRAMFPLSVFASPGAPRFERHLAESEIRNGPLKDHGRSLESHSAFLARAAELYVVVFGDARSADDALGRAMHRATSPAERAIVLQTRWRVDPALQVTPQQLQTIGREASSCGDCIAVAQLFCDLQQPHELVSDLIKRAERAASDDCDWRACGAAWFDLLLNVEHAERCFLRSAEIDESPDIFSFQGDIERLVLADRHQAGKALLEKTTRGWDGSVMAGESSARLALAWTDLVGDTSRAKAVLQDGERHVTDEARRLKKSCGGYPGIGSGWAAIARAWSALGENDPARRAIERAREVSEDELDTRALREAESALALGRRR